VKDLAEHQINAIDVSVTLHDRHQPLCVDGLVMNGIWGPQRPSTAADAKDGTSPKQEKYEDIALASSPVTFAAHETKELQMDLRWLQVHLTGTIAQSFALKHVRLTAETAPDEPESWIWLFQSGPASGQGEEPLNTTPARTSLKDIQRAAPYVSPAAGKKPLNLHAVEMPFPPGPDGLEQGTCAICLRFFDSAVREVGSEIVYPPTSGTVQDVLQLAEKIIKPEWNISTPLRALEVSDGRLQKFCRNETLLRSLSCFGKPNLLWHCLRIEADIDNDFQEDRLIEVFHCDRTSQQAFGHPLLIAAAPGERAGSLKTRCKERLGVPEAEFKSWRLVRTGARHGRVHLKDDEPWDGDPSQDLRISLEHVHPNPSSSFARNSRYHKPLTIK